MSYDISMRVHMQRQMAEALELERRQDERRMDFLRRLDAAPFEVTDWEAQFIESFLTAPRPMTDKQRDCIDHMRHVYEGRL